MLQPLPRSHAVVRSLSFLLFCMVVLSVVIVFSPLSAGAAPVTQATATPGQPIRPVLECVADLGDGHYRAFFGYKNENSVPVSVNLGPNNKFTPSPENRGQPTTFQVGRQVSIFSVDFNGSNLVWKLNTRTATASSNSTRCSPTPTPTAPAAGCPVPPLGPATTFNVFVRQNFSQTASDTEGRLAAGGAVTLNQYAVGAQLDTTWSGQDILIAGNTLAYTNGHVYRGNAVYGTTAAVDNTVVIDGVLRQATPIDFAAAFATLQANSIALAALTATGTTTVQYGGITLNGNNPSLNVFVVNGTDLAAANNVVITVPNGSAVLVNINGTTGRMANFGFTLTGATRANTLFNFYQATTLELTGIGVEGSILAPDAAITFPNGVVYGTVVGKSVTGNGQFNHVPYTACPPIQAAATPTATNTPTVVTPSETPIPSATHTEEPSATSTPAATATSEPTATETPTVAPSATPTLEPTATTTPEPSATTTPEPSATVDPAITPSSTPTLPPDATPTVTASPTASDTIPPTAPGDLQVTATLTESVGLSWTPATDNIGVVRYDIYLGTDVVASTILTATFVPGLTTDTSYTFTVRAVDAAGNRSLPSNAVTDSPHYTPPPTDSAPPTTPANFRELQTGANSATLTWDAASDDVEVVQYEIYSGSDLLNISDGLTTTIDGLLPGTTYTLTLRAADEIGNLSGASAPVVITTDTPPYRVESVTLLNGDTGQPISGFDPITNGAYIELTELPTRNLKLRATVTGTAGSVVFDWATTSNTKGATTVDSAPFVLDSGTGTTGDPWTLDIGTHTFTVTPYAQPGGTGDAGSGTDITFSVTNAAAPNLHLEVIDTIASEDGVEVATLRIVRTAPLTDGLTVRLDYRGTARPGVDVVTPPDTVLIPAGSDGAYVDIRARADAIPEGTLDLDIALQPASTYKIASPATAVVTVVDSLNAAPFAEDATILVDNRLPSYIDLSTLITEPDRDVVSFQLVDTPDGSAAITGTRLRYTPVSNFTGLDSLTYRVSDGRGGTDEGKITFQVQRVNAPPFVNIRSVTLDSTAPASIDVSTLAFDAEGDTLIYALEPSTITGQVSISGSTITYTPTLNYAGNEVVPFRVSDGNGYRIGQIQFSVLPNIPPVQNRAPRADTRSLTLLQGDTTTLALTTLARDPDGDTMTFEVSTDTGTFTGTFSLNGTTLTYTPPAGYTGVTSVIYTATDDNGLASRAKVSFVVATPGSHPIVRLDVPQVVVEPLGYLFTENGESKTFTVHAYQYGEEIPIDGTVQWYAATQDDNNAFTFTPSPTDPTRVTVTANGPVGYLQLKALADGIVSTSSTALAVDLQPGVVTVPDGAIVSDTITGLVVAPGERLDRVLLNATLIEGSLTPGTLLVSKDTAPIRGRIVSAAPVGNNVEVLLTTEELDTVFADVEFDLEYGWEDRLDYSSDPTQSVAFYEAGRDQSDGLAFSHTTRLPGKASPGNGDILNLPGFLQNGAARTPHAQPPAPVPPGGPIQIPPVPDVPDNDVGIDCRVVASRLIVPNLRPRGLAVECTVDFGSQKFTAGGPVLNLPGGGTIKGQFDGSVSVGTFTITIDLAGGGGVRTTRVPIIDNNTGEVIDEQITVSVFINFAVEATGTFALKATGGGKIEADVPWPAGRFQVGPYTTWPVPISAIAVFTPTTDFVAEFKGDVDFTVTKRFTIECDVRVSRENGFERDCNPIGFNPRFDPARGEGVNFHLGEEASIQLNLTVLNIKTDAYVGVLGEIEYIRKVGKEFAQFCRTLGRRGPRWGRGFCNATAQTIEDALKIENRLLGLKGNVRVGFIEFKVKGEKGIGPRYDMRNIPLPNVPTLPGTGISYFGYGNYGFGYEVDLPIVGWVARGEGWAQDQLRRYFDLELPRLPPKLYKRGDIGYPAGAGSPLPPEGNVTDRPSDNRIPSRICGPRPSGTPSGDPFPQPTGIFEFPSVNPTVRVSCRETLDYCPDGVSRKIRRWEQRTEYLDGTIRRFYQFEPNISFDFGGGSGGDSGLPRIGPGSGGGGPIRNVTVFVTKATIEATNCEPMNLFRPVGTAQRISDYKWRWFVEDMPPGQYEFVTLATPNITPPSVLDLYFHLLRNNTTVDDPFKTEFTDRFNATIGNGCVEATDTGWQVIEEQNDCPSPQPSQRQPRRPQLPGRSGGGTWPDLWRGGTSSNPRRLPPGGGAPGGPGAPPIIAEPGGTGWGDPHLTTIDGASYTSLQLGEFVYAHNIASDPGGVEVQARHQRVPGYPDWASFITAAAIRAGGHTYEVRLPEATGAPLQLLIDGQFSDLLPGFYQYGSAVLEIRGDNAVSVWTQDRNLQLTRVDIGTQSDIVLGSSTEPVVALNITMSTARDGSYRGLLGTPDYIFENEFTTRDGSLQPAYKAFVEDWRITTSAESLFTYAAGEGPETYNIVQTIDSPDLEYLNGNNPGGRNYVQEARDLLTGSCSADLTLVDESFVRSLAFELAAGRTADNLLEGGLCQDEHITGPASPEESLLGVQFSGQITLQGQPTITIAGVRVVISAPQLNGAVLCDTTTFAEGRYSCSLTDFASFFGNQSTVELAYRVTGRGTPVTDTLTLSLPQPGAWTEQVNDLQVAPTHVLHLTGQLYRADGSPLANGLVRVSGPSFIQGAADETGAYDLYLPLPDGLTAGDLRYEVADIAADNYLSLFRPFEVTTPGITDIALNLTVQTQPLPPEDGGGTASQERQLLVSGVVRNALDNNNGVAGLQVSVVSPNLQGGRCDTRTGADGSFSCTTNVLTSTAFTVTIRAAGLGAGETIEMNRPITVDEIPAAGSSQVVNVELTGSFQTRRLRLTGTVVSGVVSGEAVFADEVVIRSPQLGRLCDYTASNFSSFTCEARVVINQPFDLEYTVSGEWGISQATTRVTTIPPTGDITAAVSLRAFPTTLEITGTVTDGTAPLANASIDMSSDLFDRAYSVTTNAQGQYRLTPYLNQANVVSGTIRAEYSIGTASETSNFTFENPQPGVLNPLSQNLLLNERRVNFSGAVRNTLINQTLNVGGPVTIQRGSDTLCDTYGPNYYCSVVLSGTTPFTATYTVSGTWGSGVVNALVPGGTVGGNATVTRTLDVSPTTVQFTGRVLNGSGQGISAAYVYLTSPAFAGGSVSAQTNSQGQYSVYSILQAGVTAGDVGVQVYANSTSQTFTRAFTGMTTGALNTVTNDFTMTSRTVYFRGTLNNALVPGKHVTRTSVTVTLSNGETCNTYVYYEDGNYACGVVVSGSDALAIAYTVSGNWGSTTFTDTLPTNHSGTEFRKDFALAPTTVHLTGRVSSSVAPVTGGQVYVDIYNSTIIHQAESANTDAQGDYSLYLVLNEGVTAGDIPLLVSGNGNNVTSTATVSNLTPGALGNATHNITFDTIQFSGSVTNALAPDVDIRNTRLTIAVGNTVVCDAINAAGYYGYSCNTVLSIPTPFTATYTISGAWGSETFTDTVTSDAIGGTFTKDLAISPTTVQVTGTVRDLGGNPLQYATLSLDEYNNPLVVMGDYAYTDEQGRYTMTVVLAQDVVSGTYTFYIDPYYPGEGNSPYATEIERSFTGITPNALTPDTQDFDFTERPLEFYVQASNGHNPNSYNYLYFNDLEVWSNGQPICQSYSSTCRVTITSNADFEVEYRIRGDWGSALATATIRPSLIDPRQNQIDVSIVAYPTTLKLIGTVQQANGDPSLRAYLNITSPSLLSGGYDTVDNQGQYEAFVIVREGYAGGQLTYEVRDSYGSYPTATYTYPYDVSTQGGQLVPLARDFIWP